MTTLPAGLRADLAEHFSLRRAEVLQTQGSFDTAAKTLLRWPDDALTETVLICVQDRNTVCVSTQVGCPVGCAFCASGLDGLQRNLTAGEIVEQVLWMRDRLAADQRISNVVFMGMGEPLANYDNTIKAARIINADWGGHIAARRITISTIGLPDEIRKLAREPLQITLAVSLHATDDRLRRTIVPWARTIKLEQIFGAIDYYYQQTHREVTLEYVLLDGINCRLEHADTLAGLAKRTRCNVNLINYNSVAGTGFHPASRSAVEAFMQRLLGRGVNCHLRRSAGVQIDAACGQLRRRHAKCAKR